MAWQVAVLLPSLTLSLAGNPKWTAALVQRTSATA